MQAWDWQRQLVEQTLAAAASDSDVDSVLILQHPPVYTLGTGSTPEHLLFDPAASQIPLYRTERGGEVTYHGPGQVRHGPPHFLSAGKPLQARDRGRLSTFQAPRLLR
jgi:lipoate-protein ligase B